MSVLRTEGPSRRTARDADAEAVPRAARPGARHRRAGRPRPVRVWAPWAVGGLVCVLAGAVLLAGLARGGPQQVVRGPQPVPEESPSAQQSVQSVAPALPGAALRPSAQRSGLPWPSGVFVGHVTPKTVAQFERWRGRPVDLVLIWTERTTWAQVTDPSDQLRSWQGTGRRLVIGTAMLPERGASLQACARGEYRRHWRSFGRALTRYGADDAVIRLGWEFNGDWYSWSATDPDAFAACWRQVVTTVRADAPDVLWEWSVSRGRTGALSDPRRAYPGDAYVDFIGVDSYDHWPAARSRTVFDSHHAGTDHHGMGFWADFARSRGKLLSVPEWGNRTVGDSVGGDNPDYVRWMREFFAQNADLLAYEAVFQADGGSYEGGRRLPAAAAAYRAGFGG